MTERPHKNLIVWKEAISLVKDVYSLCHQLPDEEKFGLASQLKRAVVSIPTNIAEGAARDSQKEFVRFLYISSGSLSEVDTLITIGTELKYFKQEDLQDIVVKENRIAALLAGLIKSLNSQKLS